MWAEKSQFGLGISKSILCSAQTNRVYSLRRFSTGFYPQVYFLFIVYSYYPHHAKLQTSLNNISLLMIQTKKSSKERDHKYYIYRFSFQTELTTKTAKNIHNLWHRWVNVYIRFDQNYSIPIQIINIKFNYGVSLKTKWNILCNSNSL